MFSEGELAIYGVPVDPTDISAKLRRYQAAFRPAYRLLKNLTEEERYDVRALLEKELGTECEKIIRIPNQEKFKELLIIQHRDTVLSIY